MHVVAAKWLREKAVPLGIEREIDVFPSATAAQAEEATDYWAPPTNYASFQEHREQAEKLLEKERNKDRMDWRPTEAALETDYGEVTYSRIGVIVKNKGPMHKIRLVHDLRRSGVNQRVRMAERVVLPRVQDVIDDILGIQSQLGPGESWECLVLDYEDAFKQLRVAECERRHLGDRGMKGPFCYKTVLFGIRSGPLLWESCRAAEAHHSGLPGDRPS